MKIKLILIILTLLILLSIASQTIKQHFHTLIIITVIATITIEILSRLISKGISLIKKQNNKRN